MKKIFIPYSASTFQHTIERLTDRGLLKFGDQLVALAIPGAGDHEQWRGAIVVRVALNGVSIAAISVEPEDLFVMVDAPPETMWAMALLSRGGALGRVIVLGEREAYELRPLPDRDAALGVAKQIIAGRDTNANRQRFLDLCG